MIYICCFLLLLLLLTTSDMTKSSESNLKELSKLVNQLSERLTEINSKLLEELYQVKEGIGILFFYDSFEEVKASFASLTTELRSVKGVVEERLNGNKK